MDTIAISSIKRKAIFIPVFLALFICVTNLSTSLSALLYIVISLGVVLTQSFELSIGVVIVNTVYLGYSYINIGQVSPLSNSDLINLCLVLIAVKYITLNLLANNFKIRRNLIPIFELLIGLYVTERCYSQYFQLAIFTASMLFCVYVCSMKMKEDDCFANDFTLVFTLVVITVFFYNVLQMGQYDTAHSSWIGNRFTGVRDPNNFAFWCNLGLLFTRVFGTQFGIKLKRLIYIVLTIGVLITISMSGIGSLIIIWLYIISDIQGNQKILVGAIFIMAFMVGIPIIINNTDGAISQRLSLIIGALEGGDFSTATTGRSWLWNYYMDSFHRLPYKYQLIGNKSLLTSQLSSDVLSSHNEYIDLLVSYGYIGLAGIILMIIKRFVNHIKTGDTKTLCIVVIVLLNIYFRSSSGFLIWLCLLL